MRSPPPSFSSSVLLFLRMTRTLGRVPRLRKTLTMLTGRRKKPSNQRLKRHPLQNPPRRPYSNEMSPVFPL